MSAPDMIPVSRCTSTSAHLAAIREKMKRNGRSVECRPPWFDSTIAWTPSRRPLGVRQRLDSLDHEIVRPVSMIHARSSKSSRIEHRVHQFLDGSVPAVEARKSQRLRREEVDPPSRSRNCVQDGAGVIDGGMVRPLRLSRRRAPPTGTSTVISNVSYHKRRLDREATSSDPDPATCTAETSCVRSRWRP